MHDAADAARRGGLTGPAPGVRFEPGGPLLAEALQLLHVRPRSAEELSRRVLGVRSAPPALARRLVEELLGADPRVRGGDDGVWRLAPRRAPDGEAALGRCAWAVVDVETTGGSPRDGGRILEIAVVQVRDGRVTDEFASLVDPGVPVPYWISRLTGITDAMLSDAPRFREIADLVRERLEGRIFVAHNAGYDWNFVSAEMRRARSLLPTGPRLCTVRLARRVLPGLGRRGLDSVARYYGVEIERRHRAPDDARATARILVRLLAEAERRGAIAWPELRRWLSDGRAPRTGEDRPSGTGKAAAC